MRWQWRWQQSSISLGACRRGIAGLLMTTAVYYERGEGKGEGGLHAMWDAKNKTVSGCYENAFIARQNKSIKTDELLEHSDTKTTPLQSAAVLSCYSHQFNSGFFQVNNNYYFWVSAKFSSNFWRQNLFANFPHDGHHHYTAFVRKGNTIKN